MSVITELFVATEPAARRYHSAWDEEAALGDADAWYDEAPAEGLPADEVAPEEPPPTGPLDDARDALVDHDQRQGLFDTHLSALWRVLDGGGGVGRPGAAPSLEVVPVTGTRLMFRLPVAFTDLLASLRPSDVGGVAREWLAEGGPATDVDMAVEVVGVLSRMAVRAQRDGLRVFLYLVG